MNELIYRVYLEQLIRRVSHLILQISFLTLSDEVGQISPDTNPIYGLMVRPYPNDLWQS